MIKHFIAITGLLLCFLFSFCAPKSYCKNDEYNSEIPLIIHTLSSKNIKIDLDKTKNYDKYLLYISLRSFILKSILLNINFDKNSIAKITNQSGNDYHFEFEILKQSDLYPISYV